MTLRMKTICWVLAVILPLAPAVITFLVLSALGLKFGSCEDDLNGAAITRTWLGMAAASAILSYPLFLVGGRHVLPKARRDQLAPRLGRYVAFTAAVATLIVGLVYVLTHTSCAD